MKPCYVASNSQTNAPYSGWYCALEDIGGKRRYKVNRIKDWLCATCKYGDPLFDETIVKWLRPTFAIQVRLGVKQLTGKAVKIRDKKQDEKSSMDEGKEHSMERRKQHGMGGGGK